MYSWLCISCNCFQSLTSGDLVGAEDVMSLLRPFCADIAVEVSVRLDILQMLEQCFKLSDKDLGLLILYRTQALVSSAWTDKKVCIEAVLVCFTV